MIKLYRSLPSPTTTLALAMLPIVFAFAEARAEECAERFKTLLVQGNGDEPVEIEATQEIVGAMTTKNKFYQAEPGHWMSAMMEPAGSWTLVYDDVMYSSSDQGKSWSKVREMDSASNAEGAKKALKENAATTTNAVCSEEELDGVVHETVEADFESKSGMQSQNHYKYWINPETGYIRKAYYHMKSAQFESKTTQLMKKAPDLQLPTPQ